MKVITFDELFNVSVSTGDRQNLRKTGMEKEVREQ